jgi:hypothetical protein
MGNECRLSLQEAAGAVGPKLGRRISSFQHGVVSSRSRLRLFYRKHNKQLSFVEAVAVTVTVTITV